jgi:hypothetical protein
VAPAFAAQFDRHEHVLQRRQRRDQLEILKHEPDVRVAHPRPRVLAHRAQLSPASTTSPPLATIEARAQPEQRRLAAAARPDDRHTRPARMSKLTSLNTVSSPRRRG